MSDADDEFLREFLVESYENLDTIDSRLIELETTVDADSLAAVFRAMHTIKGTSGFFGFSAVEHLGHVAENMLGRLRDGELVLTAPRASALLAATTGLRDLFAGIEATGAEPDVDISATIAALESLTRTDVPDAILDVIDEPDELLEPDVLVQVLVEEMVADTTVEQEVEVDRRAAPRRKATAAPAAKERRTRSRRVVDAAAEIEAAELAIEAEREASLVGVAVATASKVDLFDISPPAASTPPIAPAASPAKQPKAAPKPPAAAPRTPSAKGDDGDTLTGALLVAASALTADDLALALALQGEGDRRPLGDILVAHGWVDRQAVESVLALQRRLRNVGEPRQSAEDSTIRLDVAVLDELMNLVGELVLARNSLVRSISGIEDRGLHADSQRIDLVTSELQARVLRTRMRPIRSVWAKLPRLVREVSATCGRSVTLVLDGEDTELDKSVVEAIKDPMTHCVRNAIDHGIESPEDRIAAGKPPHGTLHLRASHENGQVVIQVRDDGRGIDPEKLRAKAVEKGIHPEDVVQRMSDREVLDLIFAPGFSTAAKVTEVSGRGVGMDVVRTNVERIGGTVSVSSVVGEGSTFTFAIPLTLAIIPALLVGIGSHRYAVPQTALVELVRLTGDDTTDLIEDMHGLSVYRLRGRLLPIVDAAGLLGVEHGAVREGRRRLQIAVLQAEGGAFGLVVDEVHGTEEIVVKPIGPHYSGLGCFAGATILGDGVVALIMDVAGLAQRGNVASVNAAASAESASAASRAPAARPDDQAQYVIVSLADGSRHAVPLDKVARLEKFDRAAVEEVAGNRVVQYRNGLLPLTTIGPWPASTGRPVVAAVVTTSLGEVGLVVERVLDVATGAHAEGGAITVTDERATEVVDVEALIHSCRHLLTEVS